PRLRRVPTRRRDQLLGRVFGADHLHHRRSDHHYHHQHARRDDNHDHHLSGAPSHRPSGPGDAAGGRVSRLTEPVHDVVVVGAGPAGVATSLGLADAGLDVVLIDKATFPRDKTCGDGLTTLALRELEALGLASDTVPSWI